MSTSKGFFVGGTILAPNRVQFRQTNSRIRRFVAQWAEAHVFLQCLQEFNHLGREFGRFVLGAVEICRPLQPLL